MKCPRCEQENPSPGNFCSRCAEQLGDAVVAGPSYAQLQAENEQLKGENQGLRRSLGEASEQQAATAEILRLVSRASTSVEAVFDTILANALRLCETPNGGIFTFDGHVFRPAAVAGWSEEFLNALRGAVILPGPETPLRRVGLARQVSHVADILSDPSFSPPDVYRQEGMRTALAVPMLKEGRLLGALTFHRHEVRPFTEKHIALIKTFADQAVIAIENVRLFTELQEKNRALTAAHAQVTEALEQQTATSEILSVISSSPTDVQPIFDTIARSAARLCDATVGGLARFDGNVLEIAATYGYEPDALEYLTRAHPRRPGRDTGWGRAVLERRVIHVHDVTVDTEYQHSAIGYRTLLAVPLLREQTALGAIAIWRREVKPFSDQQIALVETFADQAVIAIENVRLFTETKEALERQTATAEILRVIASSPTDLQPVLDAVAESAARVCAAEDAVVMRVEHDTIRPVARFGTIPPSPQFIGGRQLSPRYVVGRAILDRRTIHIANVGDVIEEFPEAVREFPTILAAPLVREGAAVGAIVMRRREVKPFTDKQIAMLQTFADQAVIAIENVRLFTELQARNRQLSEALDQQTATSEILRVISSSPTDVQPVFDTIVGNAVRLCGASHGGVYRFDGELVHSVAHDGYTPEQLEQWRKTWPRPVTARTSLACEAIRARSVVQSGDVETRLSVELTDEIRANFRARGSRSVVSVPMMRQDAVIGAISLAHPGVDAFSDAHVELLKTFADQAVIAIENVRLFTELQEKNRALTQAHAQVTEALERQTATSEILRVIAGSPTDLQHVMDTVAENAARLCGATDVIIRRIENGNLRLVAQFGSIPAPDLTRPISRDYPSGLAIIEGRTIHVDDVRPRLETEFPRVSSGIRTVLAVPLLREGVPIGAIVVRRAEVEPFTDAQIGLLQTFADQAVIAIENARLFKELEARNSDLSETLEQQTATAEILRIISQSRTDVQPVFDAIALSAMRLCGGDFASVFRVEGEQLVPMQTPMTPEHADFLRRNYPRPIDTSSLVGRSVVESRVVHVPDLADPSATPGIARETSDLVRRSQLTVPMLRNGEPVGVIAVSRRQAGAFSGTEIELLKTFSDQAVIAIENARLLAELQARTQQLTRSVGELQALGEVGQAISSTLDLQTVLGTIVAQATRLADADAGVIYEYDEQGEVFEPRATERLERDIVQALVATPVRKGQGVTGRLAEVREPIQLPDVRAVSEQVPVRDVLIRAGYRALLAVPLVREDHLIGGLTVFRKTPGEYAADIVELLKTFATQSSLALQNARLFRELADKSRQLEAASQHKSEFLANMSHELRTPLNAIIGFSEVLSERMFGELNDKQDEYLKDIHASGQHLLSLINDILDLSKIEAGKMELELSDFDLPMTIDNALMLVRERAARRSIALNTAVDARVGRVHADERKIRQILLNLLSNAIKFTPEGGRIHVEARSVNEFIEVSVTDTGVGIAPKDQEAVFEEFRQVGTADKKVEGTGLGLALSRKFIELHGGKIWVESQVGAGSTFTFTIPVRRGE